LTTLDITRLNLNGTHIIEASAGTGKTHAIVSIFLRLIAEGYRIDQILVVTFTEAATAELRDRIRTRLRDALGLLNQTDITDPLINSLITASGIDTVRRRFYQAIMTFDEAAVFTIHGFCSQILQTHAFESDILFDARLQTESDALFEEIAADFWAKTVYPAPLLLVQSLLQNRIEPGILTELSRMVCRKPEMAIIPDPPDSANPLAGITAHYQRLRSLWHNHQAKILSHVETSLPALHARYYKSEYLSEWQTIISDWLEPPLPIGIDVPQALIRLSDSELAAKTKKGKEPPRHEFFTCCDKLIHSLNQLSDWFLRVKHDSLTFSRIELERRKARQGILFFDDLITRLDRALQQPGGDVLADRIKTRFPAALIDEFQDTDPIQYRIFQRLYRNSGNPFFMIGDPKQSIYGFRGADIFAYLKAVGEGSGQTYSLQINWRSDSGLIDAVNTLFEMRPNPFLFSEIQFHPVSPPVDTSALPAHGVMENGQPVAPLSITFIKTCAAGSTVDPKTGRITKDWMSRHLPDQIAADIARLLKFGVMSGVGDDDARPVTPGDIAVLVRTNRQAQAMQDALRAVSIPAVLESADSVWDSKESQMLRVVLKAVANPGDHRLIAAAITTDLFGLTAHDVWELSQNEDQWGDWAVQFRAWHVTWTLRGLIPMMNQILGFRDPNSSIIPLARLIGFPDGERRVSNVLHLTELLFQAAREQRLEIPGLMQWFETRQNSPHTDSESAELRLESDARAVKLATIHKSKGLEYPVVYCPWLWMGKHRADSRMPILFHDRDQDGRMTLDLGSDQYPDHQLWAEDEDLAERLRLLYVAVTRARHLCLVYTADVTGLETSALGYLLHGAEPSDENRIQADIRRLMDAGGGNIGLRELSQVESAGMDDSRRNISETSLIHRTAGRSLSRKWRISSFSDMTSPRHIMPDDLSGGRDHDIAPLLTGTDEQPRALIPEDAHSLPILLHQFDRGPVAGIFFHSLFENMDFTSTGTDALTRLITDQLTRAGMDSDQWTPILFQAVIDILDTPLDPEMPDLTLRRIPLNRRMNELAFLMPAAVSSPERQPDPVTASRLVTLFESGLNPAIPDAWLHQLRRLEFPAIAGFLKGFIDLVFEYAGKWYVVDYKSNMLGPDYADYAGHFLEQAMTAHHYYLQYHLYVAALHRYLEHRIPGYDYDRRMGKVYYLFIRGMSKVRGPEFGVFQDRPPKDMIMQLSDLFG